MGVFFSVSDLSEKWPGEDVVLETTEVKEFLQRGRIMDGKNIVKLNR